MEYRTEEDLLGKLSVPEHVYWGINTQRAIANFQLSGAKMNPALIRALAMVKKACALANTELEYLDPQTGGAIGAACMEIINGQFLPQFPIDALSGGAGTSANMNANEVIANRASEHLDGHKGADSLVSPLAHVNLHQSTNDVYPTAVKVACIYRLRALAEAAAKLQGAFQGKEKEFSGIIKTGRTELQEAVPVTLGAEFSAFAEAFSRDRWRCFKCEERLRVVNLGATAVGTGMAAPRTYIFLVIEKLRDVTGLGLSRGENLMGETANADAFVEVSGILKAHAANLLKVCNDLRLLNLLGEIKLPPMQAGSSIMPGKVNPVICEAAMQCAMKVIANDYLVTECASRGSLQINEFLPLLSHALLESMDLLINADTALTAYVDGTVAEPGKCKEYVDRSTAIVTAFVPVIGYKKAEALLLDFKASGRKNLREFLTDRLGAEVVEKALSPYNIVSLGYRDDEKDTKGA